MKNAIQKLCGLGQSVWCDHLSRAMIEAPAEPNPVESLRGLIRLGVVGVTSNPTIFLKALSAGGLYDDRLAELADSGLDAKELYERLVLPDIADAADLLLPVYEQTDGRDGFVSLEVDPELAFNTEATVKEARRLFTELDRPNVMIKVPATDAGMPAIETLIGEGVNVNVTLIFSIGMHDQVMNAYLAGLGRLDRRGGDLSRVASVASFFVSRVDTAVDKLLAQRDAARTSLGGLLGKAAVANARLAYARFEEFFDRKGEFGTLAARGARRQRPLWASTSTKNPAYPDTLYVDELVGPDTVNTMPPETITAVLDHGRCTNVIRENLDEARQVMTRLADLGIDMAEVTVKLTIDGVDAFAQSFRALLARIEQHLGQLRPVG